MAEEQVVVSEYKGQERKVKVRLQDVTKVFGNHPEKAVDLLKKGVKKDEIMKKTRQAVGVAKATFDIYEGETLVIMGLSGSGKSTLVRCINRLIDPTYGKVVIDGIDVTKLKKEGMREIRQQKFGMVFQRFALFPHRTVLDNTIYGLDIQGVPKEEARQKGREVLEIVGLKGWENYYPGQLSGGMQQRVGLARALAVEPDILLMDEAFSALDPLIRTDMQDELMRLESTVQKTIIFITHDLDEALKIGDRIVLMKDAEVVQIGTPEEILMNPANRYVERFVENVDIAKVMSAKDVMIRPHAVTFLKDGPRTALHNMREAGISDIFVIRQSQQLVGYLTAKAAKEAVDRGEKSLDKVIEPMHKCKVSLDTPVKDILPIVVDSKWPVAVVDEKDIMKGVIVESSILSALAGRSVDHG